MLIDDVIGPWRALQTQARDVNDRVLSNAATARAADTMEPPRVALQTRDQILLGSWLVLLDFAAFLRRYLPPVSALIEAGAPADPLAADPAMKLYTALTRVVYEHGTGDAPAQKTTTTLAEVLKGFEAHRTLLELQGPTLLTDATRAQFAGLPRFAFAAIKWPSRYHAAFESRKFWETFTEPPVTTPATPPLPTQIKIAVEAALKERAPDAAVPPPPPIAQASIPANRTTRFVLRCVLDRPLCGASGAVASPIVSEPTEPFAMAAFFDHDAPARQVRIALPVDTSPAGLRKYPKSASFLVSDVLCGQIGGARELTLGDLVLSVLPWPFHKDLPEPKIEPCRDGMICSLSIPIVTLCALILLIIITILFNIFFFWLPFLISCFPLKLKAKEQL
jgi:hypothetical protein